MKKNALLLLVLFQNSFPQCVKPATVQVLPVFFVATDASPPTAQQKTDLMRHMRWAQSRYLELLGNRSTFAIADTVPLVYKSDRNSEFYVQNGAADNFAAELMTRFGCTRYNCPYIFVVVFLCDDHDFPTGGGRPFNGGYGTGGGVLQLSSYALSKVPNFQSTLQHELGHSFGLPHVDVYGYAMDTSMSFMSYNPKHHTYWFDPSATPGIMLPEDIRGLALNDLVFPELEYDSITETPAGYAMADIVALGIEEIPGQPYVSVSTASGSQYNTEIMKTLYHLPNATQYGNTLRVDLCWLSDSLPDGWTEIVYDFRQLIRLDGLYVHMGFGADPFYHYADSIQIYRYDSGSYRPVAAGNVDAVDCYVSFDAIRTDTLKVRLKAQNGVSVCLRGIGFFDKGIDLFPPYIPYIARDPDSKLFPGAVYGVSPVNDTVVSSQPDIIWHTSKAARDYRLQIDTTMDFCEPFEVVTADTHSIAAALTPGKSYYWRVNAMNDFRYGSGAWSAIRTFTVDKTAGNRNAIRPGPVKISMTGSPGYLECTFDVATPPEMSLRIFTLQGRLVTVLYKGVPTGDNRYCRWKLPLLGKGVYLARLNAGEYHLKKTIPVLQ